MKQSLFDELDKAPKKAPKKLGSPKVPEASILDKVSRDPRFNQSRSIDWFKRKISELGGNSPSTKTDLLKTTKDLQTLRPKIGSMYLYKYNPLTESKESMAAYDMWPLVICTSLTDNGWVGQNMHYLGYELRRRLFDKIWMIAKSNINDQQRCARLTWKLLGNVSKFPEIAPCVHQYRYDGLQSRMIQIPMVDWVTAIHLPVESFAKKSFAWVARSSTMKIQKIVRGR